MRPSFKQIASNKQEISDIIRCTSTMGQTKNACVLMNASRGEPGAGCTAALAPNWRDIDGTWFASKSDCENEIFPLLLHLRLNGKRTERTRGAARQAASNSAFRWIIGHQCKWIALATAHSVAHPALYRPVYSGHTSGDGLTLIRQYSMLSQLIGRHCRRKVATLQADKLGHQVIRNSLLVARCATNPRLPSPKRSNSLKLILISN